jgi:predicted dehydrogenase
MLNYGMVGGGPGAFIGDVHRKAIRMDDNAKLTAGCFSRNVEKSKEFGKELGIKEDCLYSDFEEMAKTEASKEDGISFVVCVTPNVSHFIVCKTFLENGINVVCDKPLTFTSNQSRILADIVKEKNLLFGITYTYTGYPAVKQMREMVKKGDLGKIRFVNAEYPQDWLAMPVTEDNKLAPWRMDPKVSGITNCLGDIGTHIENLAAFVTGLKIKKVSAHLDSLVEGRTLDDNAVVNIEYESGAKGLYWSSQIAFGNDNAVRIRIFGEKGGLEWVQENPDHFTFTPCDSPKQIWSRGRDTFETPAQKYSRIPAGHQEGIYESFANIYKSFITALTKKNNGEKLTSEDLDFPTVEMGFDGVNYVEKCVESNRNNSAWININE